MAATNRFLILRLLLQAGGLVLGTWIVSAPEHAAAGIFAVMAAAGLYGTWRCAALLLGGAGLVQEG